MNIRYLKYLKCYCNNPSLEIKYYDKGRFIKNTQHSNIKNGVLLCKKCQRWYPIEDSILIILPDNLIKYDHQNFISKYGDRFRRNNKKESIKNHEDTLKINEINKRDEEADIYHNFGSEFHDKTEREHFLRILRPDYNEVIIELGCGTGRITEDFAGKVSDYIAIDFSKKSLELLKKKVKADILCVKGDVCNLPIRDGIASKIISAQVFEHIPGENEQQKFIKEIKRVLKNSGQAGLTIYNYSIEKRWKRDFQKKGFHADKIYYENFTSKELLKHFQSCFEILELRGINCYLPKLSRLKSHFLRKLIESVLSRTFLNPFLGNIWLLSIRKGQS
jgi:ubiquinone/menaquinone biosynthesis C-methylase UbiE/uncharacterized protein YbaR (Trm112 family)